MTSFKADVRGDISHRAMGPGQPAGLRRHAAGNRMAIPNVDPIIVAPTPNPLRPDDSIDHDALARNVQRWLQTPLSGFVVGSAGGEENFLGDAERVAAVKTVAEAHEGQKFVIGGVDNPSTTNTLRLAESMCAAGADLVRVRIPVGGDVVAYYPGGGRKISDPRDCYPPDVRQAAICCHTRADWRHLLDG